MRLFGVLTLVAGYCCWYTLYTRTWGDGSGFLYNLTGSQRWGGAPDTGSGSGGGKTAAQSGQLPTNPTGAPTFPGGVGGPAGGPIK